MNKYIEDRFGLDGKTAIVVGASRGIGRAISEGLSKAGADVYGFARSKLKEKDHKKFMQYKSINFNSQKDMMNEFNLIKKQSHNIDILVNAAGITINDAQSKESIKEIFETNLFLAYDSSVCLSRLIEKPNKASIINITSIAAYFGFPNNPSYVSSKSALAGLTRSLAYDFAKKNIRVNSIAPGYINTAMTEKSFKDDVKNKNRLSRMLINRWGGVDDIVGAAIFLASNSSSYITGTDIIVDGGWKVKGL